MTAAPLREELAETANGWGGEAVGLPLLAQWYDFDHPDRVGQFIGERPFLVMLLTEARTAIGEHFPGSRRMLRVSDDPDEVDPVRRRQLVLEIVTRDSPPDALARLRDFDAAWWLPALERAQQSLCITLEFGAGA